MSDESVVENGRVEFRCEPAQALPDLGRLLSLVRWPTPLRLDPDAATSATALDVSVRDSDSGEILAYMTVLLPGSRAVLDATRLEPRDLEGTAFLARFAVRVGDDQRAWVACGLYAAIREARLRGLTTYGAWLDEAAKPYADVFALRPVPGFEATDSTVALGARDISYAMIQFADAAIAAGHPVTPHVLVDEIMRSLARYFQDIWQTAWFRAVYEGRLSREAYVYALGNLHQFVRYTTRLIGRCVAHSEDSHLRAHFAKSLREELNHELIIEQDLAYLGEDVDYVVRRMAPSPPTRRFMATQESAIGFNHDPILLLAAPLAAEGIAGGLDQAFMDALHQNLLRWGVPNPARATLFFSSHIQFDGGDDGHYAAAVNLLERYIEDEARLQLFRGFLSAATEAMLASYETWYDDVRLFSARIT